MAQNILTPVPGGGFTAVSPTNPLPPSLTTTGGQVVNPNGTGVGKGTVWPAAPGVPSGGNIQDPTYAAQLVSYYANQPGADPSMKTDPGYWIGKLTSGPFGTDQTY